MGFRYYRSLFFRGLLLQSYKPNITQVMILRTLRTRFCTNQPNKLDQRIQTIRKEYQTTLKKPLNAETIRELNQKNMAVQAIYKLKKKELIKSRKDKELGIVKQYLETKIVEPKDNSHEKRFIPAGLSLNKLEHKKNSVLLVGIEKTNEEHGMFVQDLVKRLGITLLMTQIPADWPYFIKPDGGFDHSWKEFVTVKNQYSFYLNPKPTQLSQILLDATKINSFKHTLLKSSTFAENTGICLEVSPKTQKFEPNSFLCGLFCDKLQNLLCFDYPILREREYQAHSMSLENLRQLFKIYCHNVQEGRINQFDPRLLYYDRMLKPKISYITQVIKLGSLMNPRTIAICERQYSHLICQQWASPLPQNRVVFNFPSQETLSGGKKKGFLEHLQKLVILDIIISPLVYNFFIRYKTFPFNCADMVGRDQLKPSLALIWDFYNKKYKEAVQNVRPVAYPSSRTSNKFM